MRRVTRHTVVAQLIAVVLVLGLVRPGRGAPADVMTSPAPMLGADPPKAEVLRDGDASVSTQTGALSYSYPITVPPGRLGNEPKLALSYSSQGATYGGIAAGWSLSVPHIEIDTSDGILWKQDSQVPDDRALMKFISTMAGSRPLVPVVEPTSTGVYKTFRAQNDTSYTRYEWMEDDQPFRWRAYSSDGLTYYFGDASLLLGSATGRVPLTRTVDPFGNTVEYEWRDTFTGNGGLQLQEIRYTSNPSAGLPPFAKVVFEWEDAAICTGSVNVGAAGSFRTGEYEMSGGARLAKITATAFNPSSPNQALHTREISIGISPDVEACGLGNAPYRQLTRISESAWHANSPHVDLPPVDFEYGSARRTEWDFEPYGLWVEDDEQPGTITWGRRFQPPSQRWPTVEAMLLDIDGDGLIDRLRAGSNGVTCQAYWDRNTGSGFAVAGSIPLPSLPFGDLNPYDACSLNSQYSAYHNLGPQSCEGVNLANTQLAYRWLDINSDGLVDLVTAIHHDPDEYDPNAPGHQPFGAWPTCQDDPACAELEESCVSDATEPCDGEVGMCRFNEAEVALCFDDADAVPCHTMFSCTIEGCAPPVPQTCDQPRQPHERCGRYPWMIYENLGNGEFSQTPTITLSPVPLENDGGASPSGAGGFSSSDHAIVDIDGDGHLDAVLAADWLHPPVVYSPMYWFVWRGDGTGAFHGYSEARPFLWFVPEGAKPSTTDGDFLDDSLPIVDPDQMQRSTAGLSDLNGDGLQDYYWRKEGESQVRVFWNIGDQFKGQGQGFGGVSTTDLSRTFIEVDEFDGPFIETGSSESKTRLLDYDSDGRVDLLYSTWNEATEEWSPPYVKFNNGSDLWPGYALSELEASSIQQKSWALTEGSDFIWKSYAESVDLDGDGSTERIHVSGSSVERQRVDFAGQPARVLTGIHNGQGLHTAIRYAPMSDNVVVTSDAAAGKSSPHTQWVVSSMTTTDDFEASNNATTYKYRYPRWSPDDRGDWGFRGFDVVRATNARGAITEERYDYSSDWSGRLSEVLTFASEQNDPSVGPTIPTSIKQTEWTRYTLFDDDVETFHPTISRSYTCDYIGSTGQDRGQCLADPAGFVREETVWTALGSTTSGNPLPLLYAQTATVLQDGENFEHGDRRTEQRYDLRADAATYRLRPTLRTSSWQNGSSLEEYERSLTIWDVASHRFANWERTYSDAATFGTTARTYDSVGNLLTLTKPVQYEAAGQPRTTYVYDSRKLFVTSTTNELGHVVQTTTDYGTGATLRTIGPNAHSCGTSCGSGKVGKEEAKTDIDGLGRPIATWVSRDATPGYQLVKVSRVSYIDAPSGTTPTSITTEKLIEYGVDWWTWDRVSLDGHGRPIETIMEGGAGQARTTYDYAPDGKLVAVTLPSPRTDGAFVTYTYGFDSIGRPTSIRRPDGTALTASGIDLSYSGVTHTRTEVAGAAGGPAAATELIHDSFGRLSVVREKIHDFAWASTFYQYDPRNVVSQIDDPENVTTTLGHDWAGRRTVITRGSRTWSYGYDKNGNLTFEISPLPPPPAQVLDYTTSFAYDDLDRLASKIAAPRDVSLSDRTLLGIGQTSYEYDHVQDGANWIGRLVVASLPNDPAGVSVLQTGYLYDAEGNVREERRDGRFGGVVESRRVITAYGPSGRIKTVDHGDGTTTDAVATRSSFEYDGRAQPIAAYLGLSGAAPSTELATFTRNVAGLIQERRRTEPGLWGRWEASTWLYDGLGRVLRQQVTSSGSNGAQQDLTYWGGDDPRTLVHSGTGLTARTHSFAYDLRHQLTGVSTSPSSFTATYGFRSSGRLDTVDVQYPTPATGSDVRPRAVTYKYEADDPEMLSKLENSNGSAFATYAYDEAGNIESRVQEGASTTFLYDGDDQLRRSVTTGGREDYYYDHSGTRVAIVKRTAAGAVQALRYFQGSLETWRSASGTLTKTLAHVNLGTPLARIENRTSLETQYHSTLQSLLVTLNSSGKATTAFAYGPYGEVLQASGSGVATHRRRYNDKHKDELTGLSYYGYRYYDPVAQIWTSADPKFRFAPDAAWASPRKANLYGFNVGNPLRNIDPDGREDVPVLYKIIESNPSTATGSVSRGQSSANADRQAAKNSADVQNVISGVPGLGMIVPLPLEIILSVGTADITSEITDSLAIRANAGSKGFEIQGNAKGVGARGGVRAGKKFTEKTKREITAENLERNNGVNTCDLCGVVLTPGQQSRRGVTPPPNERRRDHIWPRAKGGDGTAANGEDTCFKCNGEKRDKTPDAPSDDGEEKPE